MSLRLQAPITHIVGTVESDLGKLGKTLIPVNNVHLCKDKFVVDVGAIMIFSRVAVTSCDGNKRPTSLV